MSSTWRTAATLDEGRRVFVDALAYRKGKDLELRQMAKFLAEKVKQTGQGSAARSAESVRAANGPSCGGGNPRGDERKHWRRVFENRSPLAPEGKEGRRSRCAVPSVRLSVRGRFACRTRPT